ncbi:MAG TPA: peptide-N-glycosidase F-related protein [Bacteroidales bacterium]|nr:peptide-N-glycosidase F-related protein [Bacteroidales bacterium]HPI30002.1 peptide-N-glycosidase F-related protein [Bacteroidales bacterium]HQN15957.1 peptide-N-glycosidase F-related protein [Bacteroidales bacterium]HQP15572.1 peptide-N-glycosidase F-related protein [Bacteroidales bacterium]
MQKFITHVVFICAIILLTTKTQAQYQPGDTISIQTFTFGSPQDARFLFPPDTVRVNKILMYYTLKCNPAQNPACGEWDYLTNTYLYEHTGVLDSTLLHAPSYMVNGSSPDSVEFMMQPSWDYAPHFNTQMVHTNTLSFDSAVFNNGVIVTENPFNTIFPESRSQYLWKASELLAAGLSAGNITGLRFNIQNTGSELKNLTLRIKNTVLDSLTSMSFESTGFVTVYSNNRSFPATGWNTIQFTTPFAWNGTDNLAIDISFDNQIPGITNQVFSENTFLKTGVFSAVSDKSLFFFGNDFVDVPQEAFASIDSAITISLWQYGNPLFQPQNQMVFEGYDSLNNRVINAHIPWGDGTIYWDAGNSSTTSYDRINKAANTQDYEGKWNHWAFTKNVATGSMKIYLNGTLWHSGTGKTKRMYGIKNFKLGAAAPGNYNYDGYIDEFAVWNTELDSATISKWMRKDLDSGHPYDSSLQLYYKFDDNAMFTAADSSGNVNHGTLFGLPVYVFNKGSEIERNFSETSLRPAVIFEQGTYESHIDTVITIDSVMKDPMQIVFYNDSLQPLIPMDTLTVWPSYYNHYVFDHLGHAVDSTFVIPDSLICLKQWYYYSEHFEVVNRFELGRYITPYGNGLSLGNGITWIFDLSDYRPLLKDSVHLSAGNWQELMDMRFEFILGTPSRDPLSIKNLWNGNFDYGFADNPIENRLTPKKIIIPSNAVNVRWKSRVTGHGMDTPQNCAEFCPKYHFYKVNGVQQYQQLVWRDNCALNPLYPQGGTWVYSRSNWCPGAEVRTYDFEITPFVTPGDTATLDHDVQPYTHTGGWDYYQIEDQLVTYGPYNFTKDAEVYEIKTPSRNFLYKRMNPICNNPLITIRNNGSDTLKTLTITYGLEGGTPSTFNWSGSLAPTAKADVQLEHFSWAVNSGTFYASVSQPNGVQDEYPLNDRMTTGYDGAQEFPADIIFEVKTNNYPGENEYTVKDDLGNVLLHKTFSQANATYQDTLHLAQGCYEFRFTDNDDDGLYWWAATGDGSGYCRIRRANGLLFKAYGSDFGREIYQQFTVGYNLPVDESSTEIGFTVFPNPAEDKFYVDISLPFQQDVNIRITDCMGIPCRQYDLINMADQQLAIDMTGCAAGIYFVSLQTKNAVKTVKLMLQK